MDKFNLGCCSVGEILFLLIHVFWYCIVPVSGAQRAGTESIMGDAACSKFSNCMGNPSTLAEGTGRTRVVNVQPVLILYCTLPKTRTGSQTLDNPWMRVLPTFRF